MNKFIIPCTAEQTMKALELGAPIKSSNYKSPVFSFAGWAMYKNNYYIHPTAEEMIGWLETKRILIEPKRFLGKYTFKLFIMYEHSEINLGIRSQDFLSRKEATLAAIDEALEYLIKNKK